MKKSSTSRPSHSAGRQVQIFDALVGGIGRGLASLFGLPKKRAFKVQSLPYNWREQWQEIEELIRLGGPSRLKQALIEADKQLDLALSQLGYQGHLGEKLKAAQNQLSPEGYQAAWQAHKLRNRVVHERSEVMSFEISRALRQLKNALEELTRG